MKLLLTALLALTALSANTVTDKVKDVTNTNTQHTLKKEKRKLKHEKIKMEAKAVTKIL